MQEFKRVESELYSYSVLDKRIKDIEIEKKILENDIKISTTNFDEKFFSENAFNSNVENNVLMRDEKLATALKKLEIKKAILELKKDKIKNAVSSLTMTERKLVQLKYFENLTWQEVAEKLYFTERYCKNLRKVIVKKLKYFFENYS